MVVKTKAVRKPGGPAREDRGTLSLGLLKGRRVSSLQSQATACTIALLASAPRPSSP